MKGKYDYLLLINHTRFNMKYKAYAFIDGDRIIEISDLKNDKTNTTIEFEDEEEFYDKIKKYEFNDDINCDETLKLCMDNSAEDANSGSLEEYKIKHWVSNRSFGELIDMFENDEIIVPKMQRHFVWNSMQCSRLIESIILGLPIPPLFLLEVEDNRYELIDGFQRLTTLSNYVNGRPWDYVKKEKDNTKASKLSSKVAEEIAGKTFDHLEQKYKTKIKRSTIPLIEFRQLDPQNLDSKYLIFERINTGSIKLNAMQIRKSLSYGKFMESLYKIGNELSEFNKYFTHKSLQNDRNIEALLRINCFYSYFYDKDYEIERNGIKQILNQYCEKKKNDSIKKEFVEKLKTALSIVDSSFDENEKFKKVERKGEKYVFVGNINISIMESLICALIYYLKEGKKIDGCKLQKNYKERLSEYKNTANNPFTYSTGRIDAIQKRLAIGRDIIERSLNNDL